MNLSQLWSERKKLILLGLLIILSLILLARKADLIPPSPAGRVVRAAVQPLVRTVEAIDSVTSKFFLLFFQARKISELQADVSDLEAELARRRLDYQLLQDAHARLERLSDLKLTQPMIGRNVTATIIAMSPNFWTRTVTINRGRTDDIEPDMPVINEEGLVGVVRDVGGHTALVQLMVDPEFAAGARVKRSRHRGFVEGTGEMERLRLHLENPEATVEKGDQIVTSGMPIGSLFPPGFVIGRVIEVQRDKFSQTFAVVQPNVHFDQLEEVVVLQEVENIDLSPEELPTPPL
jgi:rod shape-determining protein MreC